MEDYNPPRWAKGIRMTVAGKLAVAEASLKAIITAFDNNSFKQLYRAIAEARVAYNQITFARKTFVSEFRATGTEG